jgi:hypothetical protein
MLDKKCCTNSFKKMLRILFNIVLCLHRPVGELRSRSAAAQRPKGVHRCRRAAQQPVASAVSRWRPRRRSRSQPHSGHVRVVARVYKITTVAVSNSM